MNNEFSILVKQQQQQQFLPNKREMHYKTIFSKIIIYFEISKANTETTCYLFSCCLDVKSTMHYKPLMKIMSESFIHAFMYLY